MGYEPAVSQEELGAKLRAEYRIRSEFEMTDCTTCHR
jgi:hypothetical protein